MLRSIKLPFLGLLLSVPLLANQKKPFPETPTFSSPQSFFKKAKNRLWRDKSNQLLILGAGFLGVCFMGINYWGRSRSDFIPKSQKTEPKKKHSNNKPQRIDINKDKIYQEMASGMETALIEYHEKTYSTCRTLLNFLKKNAHLFQQGKLDINHTFELTFSNEIYRSTLLDVLLIIRNPGGTYVLSFLVEKNIALTIGSDRIEKHLNKIKEREKSFGPFEKSLLESFIRCNRIAKKPTAVRAYLWDSAKESVRLNGKEEGQLPFKEIGYPDSTSDKSLDDFKESEEIQQWEAQLKEDYEDLTLWEKFKQAILFEYHTPDPTFVTDLIDYADISLLSRSQFSQSNTHIKYVMKGDDLNRLACDFKLRSVIKDYMDTPEKKGGPVRCSPVRKWIFFSDEATDGIGLEQLNRLNYEKSMKIFHTNLDLRKTLFNELDECEHFKRTRQPPKANRETEPRTKKSHHVMIITQFIPNNRTIQVSQDTPGIHATIQMYDDIMGLFKIDSTPSNWNGYFVYKEDRNRNPEKEISFKWFDTELPG